MTEYISFNEEMKRRYGCKVYRLAVDGGCTCPNRDGTIGTRGCIFCLNGSGAFAETEGESVSERLEKAKKLVEHKNPGGKYAAYFQSYTNTYGDKNRLEKMFREAAAAKDIVAISVATRPDCLPDDIIAMLADINGTTPVWVELGLQTIHEKTAEYIRRGYGLSVYDSAVRRLKKAGLETVVHMIAGLPGESREDIIETADYIGKSGADGIKIQLLHVLRGTDLAADYERGGFELPTLEEYAEIVAGCIKVLPKNMVIHRLTGDGDRKNLIAPLWSLDKKRVLNTITKVLREQLP